MIEIYDKENIVERPSISGYSGSMWLDEQIWGHRILDDQTPWLTFLEFMNVAEAKFRHGCFFNEKEDYYPLNFDVYRRMHLRNILFNNVKMEYISREIKDSNAAWDVWLRSMEDTSRGIERNDFSYLKERFKSFENFSNLVRIIRGSVIEGHSNKRWTSRFIFPFGPNAIYDDVLIKKEGAVGVDRVNFGRTGELLYLMLARSQGAKRLSEHLERYLNGNHRLNQVLRRFQPEESAKPFEKGELGAIKSYLPYIKHPSFDRLGEDWLAIFNLGLPGFDPYQHLVILGTFHLFLYQLKVSGDLLNQSKQHLICEVIAPKKTLVRELSINSYQKNKDLSLRAVKARIKAVQNEAEWQEATNTVHASDAFPACQSYLREAFGWPKNYEGVQTPDDLISSFLQEAQIRHTRDAGNVHRNYGRFVGLISRRGTNRMRYAPNDPLLKALILANVPKRLELKDFLARIYERYGLVFGEVEAEQALDKDLFDLKAFQANALRLEQRLSSMGLLRRLSDACAYVENPFARSDV